MYDKTDLHAELAINPDQLASHRQLLQNIAWARPIDTLAKQAGARFGRNIEASVGQLKAGEPLLIEIRRKTAAVVMSPDHYQELLAVKQEFERIVRDEAGSFFSSAEEEFDQLVSTMQGRPQQAAADTLFASSGDELAARFQPGSTERTRSKE